MLGNFGSIQICKHLMAESTKCKSTTRRAGHPGIWPRNAVWSRSILLRAAVSPKNILQFPSTTTVLCYPVHLGNLLLLASREDSIGSRLAGDQTQSNQRLLCITNLLDMIHGGDVSVNKQTQETFNDTITSKWRSLASMWLTKLIPHWMHHRIVARILTPLDRIENAKQPLQVGSDILTSKFYMLALLDAISWCFHTVFRFRKVYRDHCDVTLGNMTERGGINEVPLGILKYWDHAQCINVEQSQCIVRPSTTYISLHL